MSISRIAPLPLLGYDGGMTEESDEPRPRRRVAWLIVAVLVAVLVLYPLSIGPACLFVDRGAVEPNTIRVLYWPVLRVAETNQATAVTFMAYVKWWRKVTGSYRRVPKEDF